MLALGCGAYLAFAFLQFPASTAYRWFAPADVVLSGISGTLWSGGAVLGSVGALALRDVEWRVSPLPLLIGRVSTDARARLADGFVNASASATLSTLRFTNLELATTLDTVARVLPLRGTRGTLSVDLDELTLRDGWPTSAAGVVRLGRLEVPPLVPGSGSSSVLLGDYELSSFEASDLRLGASLRDTGGPLEVAGTVAVDLQAPRTLNGAVPSFDGRVRERANVSDRLREPLEFLTVDVDGEGWRTLDLDPWLQQL